MPRKTPKKEKPKTSLEKFVAKGWTPVRVPAGYEESEVIPGESISVFGQVFDDKGERMKRPRLIVEEREGGTVITFNSPLRFPATFLYKVEEEDAEEPKVEPAEPALGEAV